MVVLWQKVIAYVLTYTLPERSCLQRQRLVHCYSRGNLLTSTESKKALTSFEDAKSDFEPPKKVLKKICNAISLTEDHCCDQDTDVVRPCSIVLQARRPKKKARLIDDQLLVGKK